MLDTNICIYAIKHKPNTVIKNLMIHNPEEICISSITYSELMYGAEKSKSILKNKMALALFLSPITVLDYDMKAAEAYGRIRAGLEKKGTPIGSLDTLIASHACSEGLTVVTNNTREFARIEGLKLEDWSLEV